MIYFWQMEREKVIEKFGYVKDLSAKEKKILFVMMEAFQESAQETIYEGEELLKMCDGCAFKKGSEANNYPITILSATECVLKHEAFFCHKRFSKNGDSKLCNGWINVMNNK